jgi:aminobenzoyl-glutamate transport protein
MLDVVEKAGNKVPHPVMIFLFLVVVVVILSHILQLTGSSVGLEPRIS